MGVDELRARAVQLSFKRNTAEGLTAAEEAELAQIRQQIAAQTMTRKQ